MTRARAKRRLDIMLDHRAVSWCRIHQQPFSTCACDPGVNGPVYSPELYPITHMPRLRGVSVLLEVGA